MSVYSPFTLFLQGSGYLLEADSTRRYRRYSKAANHKMTRSLNFDESDI